MNTQQLFQAVWERKVRFVVVFFIIFTFTYGVLYAVDFLPEPPSQNVTNTEGDALPAAAEGVLPVEIIDTAPEQPVEDEETIAINSEPILPAQLYIERLDKTMEVLNPTSRSISDLDAALSNGVVRHPDSATLDQDGNVFILGHSSYLPTVMNRHYQAFNGIQTLEWGDTIEVTGNDQTFIYRVEKVYEANATEVVVPIADTGHMLTLATCDSFGSLDDRFIVEAKLVQVLAASGEDLTNSYL